MKIKTNLGLVNKIQPQGGVSFKHEKYISIGTGELACIRIYEYPYKVDDLWLTELLKENDCIITILVYHDILDMVPKDSSNEQVDEIKKLFALIQYKFLMKQDSSSIDSLLSVFKNELTPNESNMIPRFTKGDCILIGASSNNIHLNVDVSEEELAIFKGGM